MAKRRSTRAKKDEAVTEEVAVQTEETTEETQVEETTVETTEETTEPTVEEKGTDDAEKDTVSDETPVQKDEEQSTPKVSKPKGEETAKKVGATLEELVVSEKPAIRSLASIVIDYNKNLSHSHFDGRGVSSHYSLYNTIKSILKRDDEKERKELLDVIAKGFVEFKDQAFSPVKLFRFDLDWKWGDESKEAMNAITSLFVALADYSTRAKNIKTVDFNRIHELKGLTPIETERLETYFKN